MVSVNCKRNTVTFVPYFTTKYKTNKVTTTKFLEDHNVRYFVKKGKSFFIFFVDEEQMEKGNIIGKIEHYVSDYDITDKHLEFGPSTTKKIAKSEYDGQLRYEFYSDK